VQEKYKTKFEFLHFIALSGLFPPSNNIVKNWKKHEEVFICLVKKEGKIGIDHFMQGLILYFIRQYNKDLSKYA